MVRILFGLILFAMILGVGVVVTVKPGSEAAYQAAETRIAEAIEDDLRILKLGDLSNLGELPPSLGEMTNLVQLDLKGTVISNISVVGELPNLRILNLRDTLVSDLSPLEGMADLDILDIGQTWVSDLAPLTELPALRRLDVGDTWTESLSPLTRMPALNWLNLHGAYATDGSLETYSALQAKGVTVNNGRAFRENYQPGVLQRQKVRFQRLIRRTRLGLGALN